METVKVFIRFRASERGDLADWRVTPTTVAFQDDPHVFSFDQVFSPEAPQSEVFQASSEPLITSLLEGFNGTIFAYGQSGSGKTFTMLGPEEVTTELISSKGVDLSERHGLIPRTIAHLFQLLHNASREDITATVKCSYTEIYNESVNDLLSNPPARNLRIREFPRLGMCIIGVTEKVVSSPGEVGECLASGTMNRITGATEMNQRSSRSHTIFTMTVEQLYANGSSKVAKLNLVDLAGSEKVSKTGASGKALIEAQNINLSLTTLGRCIKALASSKDEHVPYRESKLTMILKEALGGNAKTSLICTASRRDYHCEESLSTLKFAERAKKIQVKARSNVQLSQGELLTLVEKLKTEVRILREQLENRDEGGTPAPRDLYADFALPSERDSGYSDHFQSHLDRIEEANKMMAEMFAENQQMKIRFEVEGCEMKKRLDAATSDAESCKREAEDAKSMMEKFRFEVALKDASLRHVQSQNRSLEAELKTLTVVAEELRESLASLSKENEQLHEEVVALQKELGEARLHAAKIQPSLLQMQQQLAQITKRRDRPSKTPASASESSLQAIRAMVEDLRERLATRDAQLHEAAETNKRLEQEFSYKEAELQVRLTLTQAEIKSMTKAVCEFAKSEGDTVAIMKPTAAHLKPVITKLMNETAVLQKEYHAMVERFRFELAHTKEAADDRISELERKLAETSEKLESESIANAELCKAAKYAEVEQDSLNFRLKSSKAKVASLTSQLQQEQSRYERLLVETESLHEEVQLLREEMTKCREAASSEAAAGKKKWQETEAALGSQVDALQLELVRTKSESMCLADMLRTKESELKLSTSIIFDLESKLAFLSLKDQRLDNAIKYFRKRQESAAIPRHGSGLSVLSVEDCSEGEEKRLTREIVLLPDIRALYSNRESEEEGDDSDAKSYISSLEENEQIAEVLYE